MKEDIVRKAVSLGARIKKIIIATADSDGLPHVAIAGEISLVSDGKVAVSSWFCPGTLINLHENSRVSLVVWDEVSDVGYQLTGELEQIVEKAMMDGYTADLKGLDPAPQVERELIISIKKVLAFCHAPHSDVEK